MVLSLAGTVVNGLRQILAWRIKKQLIDTLIHQRALCVKGCIQHVTEYFCRQPTVIDHLK
jgi:deoxyhypusine synthase